MAYFWEMGFHFEPLGTAVYIPQIRLTAFLTVVHIPIPKTALHIYIIANSSDSLGTHSSRTYMRFNKTDEMLAQNDPFAAFSPHRRILLVCVCVFMCARFAVWINVKIILFIVLDRAITQYI